jgi:outer membrane translocation and assembly module TamA
MQWYGNIFVDTGAAYDGRRPDTYYTGAGVEVSADLDVFYLLPLTLRLGYAHGFDEVLGDNRAYLSLGASF